ncbi:MAG: GTP cyclohydrolase 1 [Chlamydiales bacterium]|nr:GTP cyclohydrolase 1 [Chlamydiales bacterium]
MTPEKKKETIAFHFEKILEALGLDLSDPSLSKTPDRVAQMYVDEIFSGLNPVSFPEVTIHNEPVDNELVLIKNISLVSFCEHHLVPMVGRAHVAYLPTEGIVGLSKIHRILRHFARRPQLQERLTEQAAESLQQVLRTDDVAVAIEMKHFCVIARGVEDENSEVETHALKGAFCSDPTLRSTFFLRISKNLSQK